MALVNGVDGALRERLEALAKDGSKTLAEVFLTAREIARNCGFSPNEATGVAEEVLRLREKRK